MHSRPVVAHRPPVGDPHFGFPESSTETLANALEQFRLRQQRNSRKRRIDNSTLGVGSPMYYYCTCCGEEEILPETHVESPKAVCDECKPLRDHNLIDRHGNIVE